MDTTDKEEGLFPDGKDCKKREKDLELQMIKELENEVQGLRDELDNLTSLIPTAHFDKDKMLENNLTIWDKESEKLITPDDPTLVKIGNEHVATEMDLHNTTQDIIDGTTPVEKVKVGALDSEGNELITNKNLQPLLTTYATKEALERETTLRGLADNDIINGVTPVDVINEDATNTKGNIIATLDNNISNGLVEYKDGALIKSTIDITSGLNEEIANRKAEDTLIREDLNNLTSRVSTEEAKLASETDEREMVDDALMDSVNDIYAKYTDLNSSISTNETNINNIVNGITPVKKIASGTTDEEGNVIATSDDALMLYGSQGPDNIPEHSDLDDIKLCGQRCITKEALASTISNKPQGESGPFDLIVGYFNADSKQPYQVYVSKNTKNIYFRFTEDGYYEMSWHKLLTTTV